MCSPLLQLSYGDGVTIPNEIQKLAGSCLSSTIDTTTEKESLILRSNINPTAPIKDLLR